MKVIAKALAPVAYDTYTGANGTSIASHTPDVGGAWSQTNASSFYLQSNHLEPNRYTDGDLAVVDGGIGDFTLVCDCTPFHSGAAGGFPDLVFRYSDSSNFWYVNVDSVNQRVQLYTVIAGTHTERVRVPTSLTSGVPVAIRIDAIGQSITLWIAGVEIVTYTSSFNQTATRVGVRLGKTGSPASPCSWNDLLMTAYAGTRINWPLFSEASTTPLVALGSSGAFDDVDVNNPNVAYDSANSRYALHYSGYGANVTNVQDAGMAYASTPAGAYTKSASNPIMSSNGTDGIFAFNGGLVKKGATWYLYYGSNNGTKIRVATATNLDGPWTRIGVALDVGAGGAWDESGVHDAFARLREDGTTIEMWHGGINSGGTRAIGYATSTDGTTFTKYSGNPVLSAPSWANTAAFGEPTCYVPPTREGIEALISFDSATAAASSARFVSQAATLDGGATWHWRIAALEKAASGYASAQVFDNFPLVDSGTMYLFHSGAPVNGLTLNIGIQIGAAQASWPYTTLRG